MHKVQGLTFDQLVVSFEDRYHNGQAYVALSRVCSLRGLFLQNFDQKKIRVRRTVDKEMSRISEQMPFHSNNSIIMDKNSSDVLSVALLNIRSLKCHHVDLLADSKLSNIDVLSLTETWLNGKKTDDAFNISGYKFVHKNRPGLKQGGGVGVYVSNNYQTNDCSLVMPGELEGMCIILSNITIIVIYRPPSQKMSDFHNLFQHLLLKLEVSCKNSPLIILGDFNYDYLSSAQFVFRDLMAGYGLKQVVIAPTHISGSCLDHAYVRNLQPDSVKVLDCYYSDHDFVILNIPYIVQ